MSSRVNPAGGRTRAGQTPGLPTPPTGWVVGSYPTYAQAQAAVDHLADEEFPVHEVTIVGVDLMQVEDLEGYGLSQYLEQGMGVSSHDLEDAHALIEGLTGTVLVVSSGAFGGQAQVLTPRAPLRLVATFNEDKAPVQFDPLPSAGAQVAPAPEDPAAPEPKKKSDAAMSGRVAMIALLILFALTAVVVWVAS